MNQELYSGICLSLIIWSFLMIYLYRYRNFISTSLILLFFVYNIIIFVFDLRVYDDAEIYHIISSQISQDLTNDFFGTLAHTTAYRQPSYTMPLALMYTFFGISPYVGKLLSTIFSLLLLIHLHILSYRLFNKRIANLTIIIMMANPYYWYLSTSILRDIIISFFIIYFFKIIHDIYEKRGIFSWNITQLLLNITYLTLLRPAILFILCISTLTFWFVPNESHQKIQKIIRYSFLILLFLIGGYGFISLQQSEMSNKYLLLKGSKMSKIEIINQRTKHEKKYAKSAYLSDLTYNSYSDIIKNLPLTTAYFLFSPFPWRVKTFKQGLGMIDTFILSFIYFLSIKEILFFAKHNNSKLTYSFIIFLIIGIITSSILASNAGSAIRHRTMFTYLLFPFAVAHIVRKTNSKHHSYPLTFSQ